MTLAHEIKGFVLEGRYVGNHAVKMLRGVDFNQINIQLACHSQAVWFVMKPGQGAALAGVPELVQVHADRDLVVLRGAGRSCR